MTSGTTITAERGSTTGVDGTVVSPAPSRGAFLRWAFASRRVGVLPLADRAAPSGALARRYDAADDVVIDVRVVDDLDEPAALAPAFAPALEATLAGATADTAPTTPTGAAVPHTSQ